MKFGKGLPYINALSKYEFCENWRSDSHILLQGVNEFPWFPYIITRFVYIKCTTSPPYLRASIKYSPQFLHFSSHMVKIRFKMSPSSYLPKEPVSRSSAALGLFCSPMLFCQHKFTTPVSLTNRHRSFSETVLISLRSTKNFPKKL
jgi:hypothetical protein